MRIGFCFVLFFSMRIVLKESMFPTFEKSVNDTGKCFPESSVGKESAYNAGGPS